MAIRSTIIGQPQADLLPYRGTTVPGVTDVQAAIDAAMALTNTIQTLDFLVKTASGSLSGERVVTDTATIAWDWATSGAAKAAVVDASITVAKLADNAVETAKIKDSNVTTAKVADANITYAKIQNVAGLSIMGRASNSSGVAADITAANDAEVLRRSGTTIGFGTVATAGIANNAVTLAKIAAGTALSVLGVTGNAGANYADITAGSDGHVLRRSGTALAFGTIATAGLTDAAVTYAKIQNVAGLSVFGRSTNSSGVGADITGTDGQVLRVNGTALGFGTIATAGITDNAVTLAKVAQGTALSVLGVTGNATANYADIAAGSDKQVLRRSGTAIGFGAVDLSSTAAVTNQLASASMPALTGAVVSAGATLATTSTIDLIITIGTGSATIITGVNACWFEVDFACTIVQWSILSDASGSISIDVWKCTHSQFDAGATHPVAGDKISASAPITFSSATKGQSSTLTGWTTSVAAGDVLAFYVSSVTTCKQVTISLKVTKTS